MISTLTRSAQRQALTDWLHTKSRSNEWQLFACSVVFRPVDRNNRQERWESEYKTRFLQKIRRRLEASPEGQEKAIPFEDLYYFERDQGSMFRVGSKRKPFHIHSLLPIATRHLPRFWSADTDTLHPRIEKDLTSIDVVQDVVIERVREGKIASWINYITKRKDL